MMWWVAEGLFVLIWAGLLAFIVTYGPRDDPW
jgi:hypothetical protein